MKKMFVLALMILSTAAMIWSQTLPKFTADFGSKANPIPNMPAIRMPYTSTIKYFGYVKPGEAADEVKNGKKMFYIYVWIPAVAPEIGIRMISPVTTLKPAATDFKSPLWADGSKDTASYFDTWVSFERAQDIASVDDIAGKIKTTKWLSYGSNDDSSEMPAQPSGSKYNSVLRITSEVSNPAKALVRGLYRIGFTTYKVGEVKGTFYAEVGAPVKLPGVAIEKDVTKLIEALKKK